MFLLIVNFAIFIAATFIAATCADPVAYGDIVPSVKYPFVVFLQIMSSGNAPKTAGNKCEKYCSGTLISASGVMTSAHCCDDNNPKREIIAHAGIVLKNDARKTRQSRNAKKFLIHPGYYPDKYVDLALIILEHPFVLQMGKVEKASLGTAALYESATVVGWGAIENGYLSEVLRSTQMTIVPNVKCEKSYRKNIKFLCAWSDNKKSTPCCGDSGGPLVVKGAVVGIITEVSSYATIKVEGGTKIVCYGKKPTIFMNVTRFMPWIMTNMLNKLEVNDIN